MRVKCKRACQESPQLRRSRVSEASPGKEPLVMIPERPSVSEACVLASSGYRTCLSESAPKMLFQQNIQMTCLYCIVQCNGFITWDCLGGWVVVLTAYGGTGPEPLIVIACNIQTYSKVRTRCFRSMIFCLIIFCWVINRIFNHKNHELKLGNSGAAAN